MNQRYQLLTKTLIFSASFLILTGCEQAPASKTQNKETKQEVTANDMAAVKKDIDEEKYKDAIDKLEKMNVKANSSDEHLLKQLKLFVEAQKNSQKATLNDLNDAVETADKIINVQNGSDVLVKRANQLIKSTNKVKMSLTDGNITLKKAQELYDSSKYDAAGGMLRVFLENDLSHPALADVKKSAQNLAAKVDKVLAEQSKQEQTNDKKNFVNERNSEVLADAYKKATGADIKEATDDQLKTWLAQREAETTDTNQEDILKKVIAKAKIDMKDKQAFVTKENDDLYQIEIRQSKKANQDDVEISNMIGLYQYVPSTGAVTKQNYLTGEFEPINQTRAE